MAFAFAGAVLAASLAAAVAVAAHAVEFGAQAGQWVYPYVDVPDARLAAVAVLGGALAAALHELGRRHVETRPAPIVGVALVVGVGVQVGLRALYRQPMSAVVTSDVVNSFYGAAGRFRPLELLRDFGRISTQLPLHARVNMPGKILFYHLLRALSADPATLALLVVVASSLVGVLLYAVVAGLTGSRALGLDAMTLWMIVPSKVGFLPMLNVVSPLPAMAAVWCLVRFLDWPSPWLAVGAGVLAYLTLFFDPLALWVGVVFAPTIAWAVVAGRVRASRAAVLCLLAAATLVATDVAVWAETGFDAWTRLGDMVGLVREFNETWHRPYDVWLTANVKDVVLALGPAMSIAFVTSCALVVGAAAREPRALGAPGPIVVLMSLAVLGLLAGLCLDRGEVARLWIFLDAPIVVAVAWGLEEVGGWSRPVVVGATFGWAALTTVLVGYCVV
jgi:hypothetical protein